MTDRIRRGQLIAPFGAGAITVIKGGTQLICAGLDHWFERDDDPQNPTADVVRSEFRVEEPRLERALLVKELLQPPDFRRPTRATGRTNAGLSIPFLRFPLWHVCTYCHVMLRLTPTASGRQFCPSCQQRGKRRRLVQVRFAAMCDRGHLQDFPWREWVHGSATPACNRPMTLTASGASLASIRVECECEKARTLGGIMSAESDGTTELTKKLDPGQLYTCRGQRPWLGESAVEPCGSHVRGTLLNATNIYFAPTASSIFLPPDETPAAPPELLDLLTKPPLSTVLALGAAAGQPLPVGDIRGFGGAMLAPFRDEQIAAAMVIVAKRSMPSATPAEPAESVPFRLEEYRVLSRARDREELKIKLRAPGDYSKIGDSEFADFFSQISLVERLRETRAFTGFGRVDSAKMRPLPERKAMLWADPAKVNTWLPAYVVFGEGIFIRFNDDRIRSWLDRRGNDGISRPEARVADLQARYGQTPQAFGNDSQLTAKLVMIHTFAHLVINRLTFECGYSSASLRERIYASSDERGPMSGVLIYTASGDSDGTMGGLVRMGKPSRLEPLIYRAIENAKWCSADPVCMELADHGQGPDSCNLAACHACALVPETSCEQFNRFLDRGVVVGTPEDPALGFFS